MYDWTWDLFARQLIGVLASAASAFLFLAILAYEWQRMATLRSCKEAKSLLIAHYDTVKKARAEKRQEREKLLGGKSAPRVMAGAVRKMAGG